MGKIYLIAAIGKNNELGLNNELIWKLPNDLKFFKEKTINKTIVMGRKTFESLKRLLPNRVYIVISSKEIEGVINFNNINDALNYIKNIEEVFIIGGASIYKQFLEHCDGMYLTEINATSNADAYFPYFNKEEYDKEILSNNEDNGISYTHTLYKRK